MTSFAVPLQPAAQEFDILLANGVYYHFRLIFRDAPNGQEQDGGWILDISDTQGNPIIMGIPLVTGADLLAQYAYLNIPGKLWIATKGDPSTPPTYTTLGVTSLLIYEFP